VTEVPAGGGFGAADDSVDGRAFVWAPPEGAPAILRFDERGVVLEAVTLRLGPLELAIPAGARVAVAEGGDGMVEIAGTGADPISLCDDPDALTGPLRLATQGPEAGVVRFEGTLPLTATEASQRYFYSAATDLAALRYPLFPPSARARVEGRIDPGAPADGERNALAFPGDDPLVTTYVTTAGQQVLISSLGPNESRFVPQWDPVAGSSYMTPDGDWKVVAPTGPAGATVDVVLGLSGLEFARVADGATMTFVADSPSYALGFGPSGASGAVSLTASCPGSQEAVTTAWTYFPAGTGPVGLDYGYFSQPREAGMFTQAGADPVLGQLALRAAGFPPGPGVLGAPAAGFPAAPYTSATAAPPAADWGHVATLFEDQVLLPERSRAIDELNSIRTGAAAPPGATAVAVTPQGLRSEFSLDYSQWHSLELAKAAGESVRLAEIDGSLRTALLSSELFLVVSDPEALEDHLAASSYRITDDVLTEAQERGVPAQVITLAGMLLGWTAATLEQFRYELTKVIGEANFDSYGAIFVELAANVELTIDDWTFDLTPRRWSADPARPTIAIIKFTGASLADLAADWNLWTDPRGFNRDPAATAAVLGQIVADAGAAGDYFADTVVRDWNGVLFLNVPVRGDSFPPELRGLAAGMSGELLAHHVGVNGSPVHVTKEVETGDSSLFALLDYRDPGDLVYEGKPYAFKVLSLHVEFANSHITGFGSQIELMTGELFGERSTIVGGEHGDNLLFSGTWQRHDAQSSYSFRTSGPSLFLLDSEVVASVTVQGAEFATVVEEPTEDRVVSLFKLGGVVRFRALGEFDVFSFGTTGEESDAAIGAPGLAVAGLAIRMTATGTEVDFAFEVTEATIDLGASRTRPDSLYARFPLKATGLLQGDESARPADAGYMPVGSPLTPGSLAGRWYAIAADLDLGSAGGLAAKADLTASLLAAWSPADDGYDVQVGLRLPGSQGGSSALTILGPLKLDIGNIRFLRDVSTRAFLLRLESIALGFLSLKLPPGGRTNLLLFGNPDPAATTNRLGWYGAYRKEE
jgi:hypothetical protein